MDKVSEKLRLYPPEEASDGAILHEPSAYFPLMSESSVPPLLSASMPPVRKTRPVNRLSRLVADTPAAIAALVEHEGRYGHGFLWVPVAIGAGAAFWLIVPVEPSLVTTIGAASFILAAIAFMRAGWWRTLALTLGLFLSGMVFAALESQRNATVILDTPVTTDIIGRVERGEVTGAGQMRYTISLMETANPRLRRPPGMVTLVARAAHTPFYNGTIISGRARLSPPSGPALPGLHDFAFSAYFDGIGAVGFFYSAPMTHADEPLPGSIWQTAERRLFALRADIGNRIRQEVPGDAGAFAAAIVTDERRAISEDTIEALRLSGLAHIVAISGLNMALAAGICFVGLRMLLALSPAISQALPVKKIAACGALAMVTCYYLISGFGVSAQRAYIMMAVMLVAVLLDRPSISLRNVAISALIILAWTPSEILGPSFQMSFAATAALVAGYALWAERARRRVHEPMPFRHPLVTGAATSLRFIGGIVLTSLIGSLATAIFSIEHFHRISTYGLAANLAAMPIISFIVMPSGLVAMLLMPIGLEGPFLALMAKGLEWVITIAHTVADWRGDVPVGQQQAWFLPLGVVGMLLLTLQRTRLRLAGVPFLIAAIMLFVQGGSHPARSLLVSEDGALIAYRERSLVMVNRVRPPSFVFEQWTRALRLPEPIRPILLKPVVGAPPASQSSSSPPVAHEGTDNERLANDVVAAARRRMASLTGSRFSCEAKAWCGLRIGRELERENTEEDPSELNGSGQQSGADEGFLVITLDDGRYVGAACDVADLVIAPRVRFDQCRSGALLFSGAILRKTGALEIALPDRMDEIEDYRNWKITPSFNGTQRPWALHRRYDWRENRYDASLPGWLAAVIDAGASPARSSTALSQRSEEVGAGEPATRTPASLPGDVDRSGQTGINDSGE